MQTQQTQQVAATQPLTVTLEAQHWSTVMTALIEVLMPHRLTNPVIQALTEQFQQQTAASGTSVIEPEPPHRNGLDTSSTVDAAA